MAGIGRQYFNYSAAKAVAERAEREGAFKFSSELTTAEFEQTGEAAILGVVILDCGKRGTVEWGFMLRIPYDRPTKGKLTGGTRARRGVKAALGRYFHDLILDEVTVFNMHRSLKWPL